LRIWRASLLWSNGSGGIVFTDIKDRKLPQRCNIKGLDDQPFFQGAVTKEPNGDIAFMFGLDAECRAGGQPSRRRLLRSKGARLGQR